MTRPNRKNFKYMKMDVSCKLRSPLTVVVSRPRAVMIFGSGTLHGGWKKHRRRLKNNKE